MGNTRSSTYDMATTEAPLPRGSFSGTIPRQHGAWSVLLLGFALGVGVAGRFGVESLLLLLALVAVMPARHTLSLWLRLPHHDRRRGPLLRWTAFYTAIVVLSFLPLLVIHHLWLLAPVGAFAAALGLTMTLLERARRDRTLAGELLGMIGLSVAVPAAYYVSDGSSVATMLGLWLLAGLMFCGGVFHVRHVARGGKSRAAASGPGLTSTIYHFAAIALTLGLGAAGLMPPAAFLALVPATARATWSALQPGGGTLSIRRLGFQELAHGLLFVLLAGFLYRTQS